MDRTISANNVTVLPFKETNQDDYVIREFSSKTSSFELVWHREFIKLIMKLKDIIFNTWINPHLIKEVGEGKIGKITIMYTNYGDFYAFKVDDRKGNRIGKLHLDDANKLLSNLALMDALPAKLHNDNRVILDRIVGKLHQQDIEATWDDDMDIS